MAVGEGYCARHRAERQRRQDRERSNPLRALYGTQRWRRRARKQLASEPLCRSCSASGRVVPATDADHVMPPATKAEFFAGELQSLCRSCHSKKTSTEDREVVGSFGARGRGVQVLKQDSPATVAPDTFFCGTKSKRQKKDHGTTDSQRLDWVGLNG